MTMFTAFSSGKVPKSENKFIEFVIFIATLRCFKVLARKSWFSMLVINLNTNYLCGSLPYLSMSISSQKVVPKKLQIIS